MINWDKIDEKVSIKKVILPILITISILVIVVFAIIIHKFIVKNSFANQMVKLSEQNEKPNFSIEKIYLCSSANVNRNNSGETLKNLNLYQYTDIAIYLNNYEEELGITSENTLKELYIDNITIEANNEIGEQYLGYSNLLQIGSKNQEVKLEHVDKIDFNIVYTNEQNENADYSKPTFYADCSNPITLRYINNLHNKYLLEDDNSVAFDGTLLEKAGVNVEDISCRLKLKINLVTTDEKYHSCWLSFSIPLQDIYKGTTIKSANGLGAKYNFFTM